MNKKYFIIHLMLIITLVFMLFSCNKANKANNANMEPSHYMREENELYFGTYPQTLLSGANNASLVAELNSLANDNTWISYEYYQNGSITEFMYYMDIDYDNNGTYDYRGVYFTEYRNYDSSSNYSKYFRQKENNYNPNIAYWFKFDQIKWDILYEDNGKALIIADLILDSQDFYPVYQKSKFDHNGGEGYASNYELSNIRKWLNDNFYNTAFNDLEKEIIEKTIVDNGISSLESIYDSDEYICNNTEDYVFLLSLQELITYYSSPYDMIAQGTDYAKCQGLRVANEYYSNGNSYWWLRTPSKSSSGYTPDVKVSSSTKPYIYTPVYINDVGIRPSCYVRL